MDIATGNNLNAGSTSSGTPVYNSASGNFDGTSIYTPTDGQTTSSLVNVGDWCSIYPTANTITPFVSQVTNVAAGVNGAITVSTTVKYGTAPGAVACKARTGGCWADFGLAMAGGAITTGTAPVSTRINIKAGTYANTTTSRVAQLLGTSSTIGLWWRGYKTTPGDQDANNLAVAGTDIPLLTFTTASITFGGQAIVSRIAVTSTITTTALIMGTGNVVFGVQATNTSTGRAMSIVDLGLVALSNFNTSSTTNAAVNCTGSTVFLGNVFVGGNNCVSATSVTPHFFFNSFSGCTADCISWSTGGGFVVGNTFVGPGGNGVSFSGSPASYSVVLNNIFKNVSTAAKAAINNSSGTVTNRIFPGGNIYYNCTANASGMREDFTLFDVGTLGSDPLPNSGTGDLTPAAAALSQALPTLFEQITAYQSYLTAGAVQKSQVGGGAALSRIFSGF